jgi:AsmA protein
LTAGWRSSFQTRKTEFGQLFDAVNLSGPLPRGTGSLDIEVTSPYPTWATALTDLTGRSPCGGRRLRARPGRREVPRTGWTERFFDLRTTGRSARFAFESARFEAMIADGEADLKIAELVGPQQMISLSGVIPYTRSSLAIAGILAGRLRSRKERSRNRAGAAAGAFFLGGSWPQPVISPVRP